MHETREAWMEAAVVELRRLAKQLGGFGVPPVRVSCGFPMMATRRNDVAGEHWKASSATDKVSQIFVHPKMHRAVDVLAILLHEMIHAADDGESGHRGVFVERMKACGMVKPWTSSTAGEELTATLRQIAKELGKYPHSALLMDPPPEKKQTTRMVKVSCVSEGHEPYIVRMSRKQMEDVGTPICPRHNHSMEAELPEDEDES